MNQSGDDVRGRKRLTEIIPSKLYQRGQILTWKYDEKASVLKEYDIGIIVNFWAKIDPDLSALTKLCYLYLPTDDQTGMMAPYIEKKAKEVAEMIEDEKTAALIMCEAGHGRSVYFSVLVAHYLGLTFIDATLLVAKVVPAQSMKPYMLKRLGQLE